MSVIKIQRNGQMKLPAGVRSAMGLADGDLVDVKVSGRRIIVTPALAIDRSKLPSAEHEYTAAQRRMIIARLAEAEKGPFFGPFKNGVQVAAFLKQWKARNKPAKLKKTG
jgi:AbrB family looped-hinge helix DNA binding protein